LTSGNSRRAAVDPPREHHLSDLRLASLFDALNGSSEAIGAAGVA